MVEGIKWKYRALIVIPTYCIWHLLHLAPLTFDQIDYTFCLASDRYGHCAGFTSGCAFESVCFLDVITGLLLYH